MGAISGIPPGLDRLREVLEYRPDTGVFIWKIKPSRHARARVGGVAGFVGPSGYWTIGLDGKTYFAHHLARFYVTGEWPKGQTDHRNLNKTDTILSNLRPASASQNAANRRVRISSFSGIKGVGWCKQTRKWRAMAYKDGKCYNLGRFDCPAAAQFAYAIAADKLHGEFARVS